MRLDGTATGLIDMSEKHVKRKELREQKEQAKMDLKTPPANKRLIRDPSAIILQQQARRKEMLTAKQERQVRARCIRSESAQIQVSAQAESQLSTSASMPALKMLSRHGIDIRSLVEERKELMRSQFQKERRAKVPASFACLCVVLIRPLCACSRRSLFTTTGSA